MSSRFRVTGSGGSRGGRPYAVLDSVERDANGGMRRVAWHRTFRSAQLDAKRRNRETRS